MKDWLQNNIIYLRHSYNISAAIVTAFRDLASILKLAYTFINVLTILPVKINVYIDINVFILDFAKRIMYNVAVNQYFFLE